MSNLLEQASLVMIPSGYKEDVVYSEIPLNGAGDLSFTRASSGTRINSQGLVEVVPWNLVQYSEDFTNAVYSKFNSITATADQTTAPNGTTTADKIGLSTASTTFPNLAQDAQYIGGQVYTFSVYLKKNTINFGKIRVGGTAFASSTNSPLFNLNTGVLVSGTGTIENVGNGWYRCSMTATADTSGAGGFAIDLPDSAGVWNGSSVYNVNDSIFAWGFMSNIGSTAKPYFPTTDRLNVPRLTYQNGGGGCPSLLLEKQSTNLLTYSEQFDNAAWNKIQISATANNTTSPDGTQNADLITTTATGVCYTYELITGTSGAYSASIYAKNENNNYLALNIQNSLNNWVTSVFDLSDGSLGEYAQGSGGGIVYVNHTIASVGNGWYRCVLNYTTNQNSYYCPMFAPLKTGNSFTSAYGEAQSNANNKTLYLWGAQLEASSYPTSYIPTTSSSATRVADYAYKTSATALIGQTEGVVFWDIEVETLSATGNENILNLDAGSYGNTIYFIKGSTGILSAEVYVTGVAQCSFSLSLPSVGRYKMALAYANNDFAFYVNGVLRGTDSIGTVPATSRFQLGNGVFGPSDGKTNQCALFKTRLTNAELASLTTL